MEGKRDRPDDFENEPDLKVPRTEDIIEIDDSSEEQKEEKFVSELFKVADEGTVERTATFLKENPILINDFFTDPHEEFHWTLLGYSIHHENVDVVEFLCKFPGIDLQKGYSHGTGDETPMDLALITKNDKIIELLAAHGATYSEEFEEEWFEYTGQEPEESEEEEFDEQIDDDDGFFVDDPVE
mmetsp:Transcript_23284/g.29685  ORF Transcript_23284/g.29685 Transcript_23284/m.29685 type:complete len:184 (-) Transcript_23284:20-571(-)